MGDAIDALFADDDANEEIVLKYPGSTKRVRAWGKTSPAKKLPPTDPVFNPAMWGKPTIIEVVPDHPMAFYRPNVFAKIVGRSIPTLKFWEQSGFVPKPPFRFRYDQTVRNYYNEEAIQVFLRLLNDRGQLTEAKIDWAMNPDLPGLIAEAWARIRLDFQQQMKALKTTDL